MESNTYHTRVVAVLLRYKEQTVLILMENQCCPFSKKYYLFLKIKKILPGKGQICSVSLELSNFIRNTN